MSTQGSGFWRNAGKLGLGLVITLWGIQGIGNVSQARAGDSRHSREALQRHVIPLEVHPGRSACLGHFTKRDYGTQIFRTRYHCPASRPGARRLMVHVEVGERFPVIINTIQIRHGRERVAYHIGRRMGQGWNEIPLDHIPWQRGELIVSFNHGRGSRIGLFWADEGHGNPVPPTRRPHGKRFHSAGHETIYNSQYF